MRASIILVLCLVGCGVDTVTPAPVVASSTAPLCGAEATQNGDGTSTMAACPFEQQYMNIRAHGVALSGPTPLESGSGATGVTVSRQCAEWYLGTDDAGITVFVSNHSGEVRSHGQAHPGFPTSSLPAALKLPIAAQ